MSTKKKHKVVEAYAGVKNGKYGPWDLCRYKSQVMSDNHYDYAIKVKIVPVKDKNASN